MKPNIRTLSGALCACLLVCSATASPTLEQRVEEACSTLQGDPFASEALQTLAEAARSSAAPQALKSRAMAACSLSLLLQGQTNAFEQALKVIRGSTADASELITVEVKDCYAACDRCSGSGSLRSLCPACMGGGACKVCSGDGSSAAGPCPTCKGSGKCALCSGKKRISISCPECKGSAKVFKPAPKVRANFEALVLGLAALCRENRAFEAQFREAAGEKDLAKRVERLRALVQAYPRRPDLAPALALLETTVNAKASEESRLRAKEAREREARERDELLALAETPASKLDSAIATLLAYLKEHPNCEAHRELTSLAGELVARRDRAQKMRRAVAGALGLLGALALAAALWPLLRKRRPLRARALPGMAKIDKTQFTDPLTLNAKERPSRDSR